MATSEKRRIEELEKDMIGAQATFEDLVQSQGFPGWGEFYDAMLT
jgi:hypothetical protein